MYIEETVITGPTVELKGKKLQGCTSRLNDSTVNWRYCGSETQNHEWMLLSVHVMICPLSTNM